MSWNVYLKRLEKTVITAPIVFTGAGILLFLGQPGLVEREVNSEVWLTLAELALLRWPGPSQPGRSESCSALPGSRLVLGF